MKMQPSLPITTVESEEEFSLFLSSIANQTWRLRQYAIILKPDRVVDGGRDAAQMLARVLAEVCHFKVLILNIYRLDVEVLGHLAAERFDRPGPNVPDPFGSLAKFLRMSGVIFGEGGRQSIYEPASFQYQSRSGLSRDGFLRLLGALSRERAAANSAPGVFICLSHQGMAEAQLESLRNLLGSADHLELCIRELLGSRLAVQFREAVSRIRDYGMSLTIKDDNGVVIARGIRDRRSMVHENELPEVKQALLRRYRPSSLVFELPEEIRVTYETTSGKYSGLVEDVIDSRDILVSMIHGDEVEECSVLYLNWAFQQLWPLSRTLGKLKRHTGSELPPVLEEHIMHLPIGIEITSSTYYVDSEGLADSALTDVASTAIYYHEYSTGLIKRDLTFQFHPEIDEMLSDHDREAVEVAGRAGPGDGIALIQAAINAGNMRA